MTPVACFERCQLLFAVTMYSCANQRGHPQDSRDVQSGNVHLRHILMVSASSEDGSS